MNREKLKLKLFDFLSGKRILFLGFEIECGDPKLLWGRGRRETDLGNAPIPVATIISLSVLELVKKQTSNLFDSIYFTGPRCMKHDVDNFNWIFVIMIF